LKFFSAWSKKFFRQELEILQHLELEILQQGAGIWTN
jgi:hypothetical protein